MLPFTREQFFSVFAAYNGAIWPAQVVAYGLALAAVVLLARPSVTTDRFIAGTLAAMWAWTGIAYHWLHFAPINGAAVVFGALFVLQGGALIYTGAWRTQIRFRPDNSPATWVGGALVVYAAILYPLIGLSFGHAYSESPAFGVTPCPVTIFTFGMFLLSGQRLSLWLLVIPFVWSIIGGSAAVLLAVPQDWLLLVSGVIAVPLIRARRPHKAIANEVAHRAAWPDQSSGHAG